MSREEITAYKGGIDLSSEVSVCWIIVSFLDAKSIAHVEMISSMQQAMSVAAN